MQILNDFQTSVRRALTEIDRWWTFYDGLIVCGSHKTEGVAGILEAIKANREAGLPFLGICHGQQLAAIEYARNVMGIHDATSEEWDTKGTFVVKKRDRLKVGLHEGESWWSNYEVVLDWKPPDNYVLAPFHPEYNSRIGDFHPLLVKYLNLCRSGNVE